MAASTKALIAEYASTPTHPSPPPSPLSHLSSPLPRIPSPPLLLPPSPTYARVPLGYRAAMIHLRATSPSTYHQLPPPLPVPSPPLLLPSADRVSDIPEANMPPQKRTCFTALASRFEVGESLVVAAARQTRPDLTHVVDYGFINTMDATIGDAKERVLTTLEKVNERVTDLATTLRQDTDEMRYFSSMSFAFEREAMYARGAWSCSEDRSTTLEALIKAQEARIIALEAQIMTLQTQHARMEWQRQEAGDMVTRAYGRIHALEAKDPARLDDLEDAGSSS
ncbi:hypothetical protein Tco_0256747 [Tanacetum coccineum]